jgi:8-oxo-dGTP diphosphatase
MEKTPQRRSALQCTIHPLGTLKTYKYVVVCSNYKGKWLLSRHRKRETWETQGGHIEAGETPADTARRELYEESGVMDAVVYPVCDYYGYDSTGHANGMVFLAIIHHLGKLPESEMSEIEMFAQLPENLTYPQVTPLLIAEAAKMLGKKP